MRTQNLDFSPAPVRLLFALACLLGTMLLGSRADAAIVATLNPTLDLYIDPVNVAGSVGQSGDVYNSNTANDLIIDNGILLIGNNSTGPASRHDRRAFLKFDLSSLNIGTVVSATLRLNLEAQTSVDDNGNGQLLRVNLSNWNSSTVTYAHASTATATPLSLIAPATNPAGGFYNVDVTSTIQGWANGSFNNFGFALKQTSEGFDGTARQFTSSTGGASLVPLLTITYNEIPPVPEPSSVLLLGLGLVGLARCTRRVRVGRA